MTFVVDGTNGLTFNDATTQSSTATNASNISSGTLGKARLPTGSVLLVVNATYSTESAISSSTFADTGLTANITPSSSTSKILVFVDIVGVFKNTNNTWGNFRLLGAGNTLIYLDYSAGRNDTTASNGIGAVSCNYLHSPATTSSVTYKVQYASNGNNAQVFINLTGNPSSTITLMEIAA